MYRISTKNMGLAPYHKKRNKVSANRLKGLVPFFQLLFIAFYIIYLMN